MNPTSTVKDVTNRQERHMKRSILFCHDDTFDVCGPLGPGRWTVGSALSLLPKTTIDSLRLRVSQHGNPGLIPVRLWRGIREKTFEGDGHYVRTLLVRSIPRPSNRTTVGPRNMKGLSKTSKKWGSTGSCEFFRTTWEVERLGLTNRLECWTKGKKKGGSRLFM